MEGTRKDMADGNSLQGRFYIYSSTINTCIITLSLGMQYGTSKSPRHLVVDTGTKSRGIESGKSLFSYKNGEWCMLFIC